MTARGAMPLTPLIQASLPGLEATKDTVFQGPALHLGLVAEGLFLVVRKITVSDSMSFMRGDEKMSQMQGTMLMVCCYAGSQQLARAL